MKNLSFLPEEGTQFVVFGVMGSGRSAYEVTHYRNDKYWDLACEHIRREWDNWLDMTFFFA